MMLRLAWRGRGASLPRFSLLLLCFLLITLFSDVHRADAQEEGRLAPTAPAPLSGAGSVTFVSQAVDARLTRVEAGQYVVVSNSHLRLHNTNRFNSAQLTLGWPGWPGGNLRFNAAELPGFGQNFGTSQRTVPTTWAGEKRESSWLVTQTTIGPDTRRQFSLDWRQTLGSGPLLTYSFGLIPASAWTGTVGSARITLELPSFLSEESLVHLEPDYYEFTGEAIEWLFVDEEPVVNPTVTFIAPHIWHEIETARAARETDPVGGNLRLAELYEQLADAGATRYAAEAEAALDAAHRADPENPEPLRRLAALYRSQAEGAENRLALLEQSVTAAEKAIEAGADEATRAALVQDLQTLSEAWTEDDPTVALNYLERAGRIAGDSGEIAARRQSLAEQLALSALQEGEFEEAIRLAEQYGLPVDLEAFPWLQSAAVRIENLPDARVVHFSVTGDQKRLDEQLGEFAGHLSDSGFPATWKDNTLSVRFRGTLEERARGSQTVASTLGPDEEWDLLRETLLTHAVEYRLTEELLSSRLRYREEVDISTRAEAVAAQLRDEAATLDSAWERALMEEAAARWEALHESQKVQVTTQFDADGQSVHREWAFSLPARDTLEWEDEVLRRNRLLLAGLGGALGLLLLLGVIWLPGWRGTDR